MSKVALALGLVCLLVGCSHGAAPSMTADISRVTELKSSFGPDFKVSEIPPRAIDPQFFAARKLPDGLTFDPAICATAAVGPPLPPGLQGNMAAVTAEGNGNRFVVIAVETSQTLPTNDPGKECAKIAFSGAGVSGGIEVVEAPHIEGVHTLGVHRVLQALVDGSAHTGELYDFSAQFGDYQLNVIANPLVVPGQNVAPVDTHRARDLLVKAVQAVRR
ncbi:DUF5642 family protein [Mycobacterium marinum]|uniref:DUF5642 family protein n=1 Tax=Mycobacterium marinum TaxID=1781 RepID=UPI00356972B8